MAEPKRRQGQKKADGTTATPKPICKKCGEMTGHTQEETQRGRGLILGWGWICPSSTCDYIIKDFVELEDTESINEMEND